MIKAIKICTLFQLIAIAILYMVAWPKKLVSEIQASPDGRYIAEVSFWRYGSLKLFSNMDYVELSVQKHDGKCSVIKKVHLGPTEDYIGIIDRDVMLVKWNNGIVNISDIWGNSLDVDCGKKF